METRWRMPPDKLCRAGFLEAAQADQLDQIGDRCRWGGDLPHLERQTDIRLDTPPGQQRRILEGDPESMLCPQHAWRLAMDQDASLRRSLEVGQNAEDRGLAATGGAEQRDELAASGRQIDVGERLHVAPSQLERLGDVLQEDALAGGAATTGRHPNDRGSLPTAVDT